MYDGYVFYCNQTSHQQCLSSKRYVCQTGQGKPEVPVREGSVVFLFNPNEKTLLGPFTALSEGGQELDFGAWTVSVDENVPSEDIKVIWEELHLLKDAPTKIPLLNTLKSCRLTSIETQNIMDALLQGEVYPQGQMQV